ALPISRPRCSSCCTEGCASTCGARRRSLSSASTGGLGSVRCCLAIGHFLRDAPVGLSKESPDGLGEALGLGLHLLDDPEHYLCRVDGGLWFEHRRDLQLVHLRDVLAPELTEAPLHEPLDAL